MSKNKVKQFINLLFLVILVENNLKSQNKMKEMMIKNKRKKTIKMKIKKIVKRMIKKTRKKRRKSREMMMSLFLMIVLTISKKGTRRKIHIQLTWKESKIEMLMLY